MSGAGLAIGHGAAGSPMIAYVGQTRSSALIAELERHGIGECVVCGELPARRSPWAGRFLCYHGRVMPRDPMSLTPDEFEALVTDHLKRLILTAKLKNSAVNEKELLKGPDGEYEIDIVVRFEALDAEFVVLVECKRHKNPVKRELVQVLYDKRRPLGAHKCMMFSTSGYQSGAIEYASKNGVALIQVTSGSMTTLTRSETGFVPAGTPDFAAWRVLPSDNGHLESLTLLDEGNPDVLSDVIP